MFKRIIITLLLSALILLSFTLIIYSNLFTEKDILDKLDEMDYYNYVYQDIDNKLKLELPNDDLTYIYENYLSKEQLTKDIKTIIENYYINEKDDIKEEFQDYVLMHFEKNDDYTKELAKSLAQTYYNNLFRIDKLDIIISRLPFKKSMKAISLIMIFVTISLTILSIKNIGVCNSFVVSGILFVIPKIFLNFKNILIDFYYFNENLSYFIKMYIYSIINTYAKYGFILLVIGLIILIIHFIYKLRLTKNVK